MNGILGYAVKRAEEQIDSRARKLRRAVYGTDAGRGFVSELEDRYAAGEDWDDAVRDRMFDISNRVREHYPALMDALEKARVDFGPYVQDEDVRKLLDKVSEAKSYFSRFEALMTPARNQEEWRARITLLEDD